MTFPDHELQLRERFLQVVTQRLALSKPLTLESFHLRMAEDLQMDSLCAVEVTMALEEEFSVSLGDERLAGIFTQNSTLEDLFRLLNQVATDSAPMAEYWSSKAGALKQGEMLQFLQGKPAHGELIGKHHVWMQNYREGTKQLRRVKDGMRCILVPEIRLEIGSNDREVGEDARPPHSVTISSFLMDAEPVSNLAYSVFLNECGIGQDEVNTLYGAWAGDRRRIHNQLKVDKGKWSPLAGTENKPVVMVSFAGAAAYSLWAHGCDWRDWDKPGGDRYLPSEAQTEAVARYKQEGVPADEAEPVCGMHRLHQSYKAEDLPSWPVNVRKGVSGLGVLHIVGNVWQWQRDWYIPWFYKAEESVGVDPVNTEPSGVRSERGGSWVSPQFLSHPSYRRGRSPQAKGRCLGFRCILPNEELPLEALK